MDRVFGGTSTIDDTGVRLALAPALTPSGLTARPSFFHGFAVHPQVLARGLVTLADVTATRYFQYTPTTQRDPVLTAQGDRLRAEVFSACNSVYARLDLLGDGLDGGEIAHGTTNVDINAAMRQMLSGVGRGQLLHLDVGDDGLAVSSPARTERERPVEMPDRWVRALGNTAELHQALVPAFTVSGAGAKAFVGSLPAATGAGRNGWLSGTRTGVRLGARPTPGSVFVSGLHRLSGTKRMLTHVESVTAYGPPDGSAGPALLEFGLPGSRLTIGLTDEAWRGFSGEGALLEALATPEVSERADLVCALLAFEPVIDVARLAREAALSEAEVRSALAVLAVSGRVGWDAHDQAWFHRELPDDPDRVLKDNPRLAGARRLVEVGAVRGADQSWRVGADDDAYAVRIDDDGWRCTCPWYLRHRTGRGPCKHVLAVQITRGEAR